MSPPLPLASFDRAAVGHRFTLRYLPDASAERGGTVVLAPPFAEEMNKCRRMTSLAARRLAALGFGVLARDLHGCGDSSGDFGDASWQDWIDDLAALIREAPGDKPLWLWGVRAGALLAQELLPLRPDANLLLWQPVTSGRAALAQFLRLKTTAEALAGRTRIDGKTLRAALLDGQAQEVAGYTISPALAKGFEAAALGLPSGFRGRVAWLEVSFDGSGTLAPAGEALRNDWTCGGLRVDAIAVTGDPFWQTPETTECEAMLHATEQLVLAPAEPVARAGDEPAGARRPPRPAVAGVAPETRPR